MAEPVAEPAPKAETRTSPRRRSSRPRTARRAAAAAAERQVVYVHAPVPPKVVAQPPVRCAARAARHRRATACSTSAPSRVVIADHPGRAARAPASSGFVNSSAFWVPMLFFAVAVDRARAPAQPGGLVDARGRQPAWSRSSSTWAPPALLALLSDVVALTPDEAAAAFWAIAGNPILFIAAILAREVADLDRPRDLGARSQGAGDATPRPRRPTTPSRPRRRPNMSERRRRSDFAVALFVTILWAAVVFAVDGIIAIVLDRDPIEADVGPYYAIVALLLAAVVTWLSVATVLGERFAVVVGRRRDRAGLPRARRHGGADRARTGGRAGGEPLRDRRRAALRAHRRVQLVAAAAMVAEPAALRPTGAVPRMRVSRAADAAQIA